MSSAWSELGIASAVHDEDVESGDSESETVITRLSRKMAQQEHYRYLEMPVFASLPLIHLMIGPSVRWYFTYFQSVLYGILFLCCCSLTFQCIVVRSLSNEAGLSIAEYLHSTSAYNWLFITDLPSSIVVYWILYLVLLVVMAIVVVYIYRRAVHRIHEKANAESEHFDERMIDDPHKGLMGSGPQAIDLIIETPLHMVEHGEQQQEVDSLLPPAQLRSIQPPMAAYATVLEVEEMLPQNAYFTAQAEYMSAGAIAHNQMELNRLRLKTYCGLICSFFSFAALLASYIFALYGAYVYYGDQNQQLAFTIGLSISMTTFNGIWHGLAEAVTAWEHHATKTSFSRSFFFKVILFRQASQVILYGFRLVHYFDGSGCAFDRLGEQYVSSLLIEFVSSFTGSIALPYLQRRFAHKFLAKSHDSTNKFMPDFVLAEKLGYLLDVFFLLICGSAVVILMPFLILALLWWVWILDRCQIKYFIKSVTKTNNTFIDLLIGMTAVQLCVVVFCPIIGLFWLVLERQQNCTNIHAWFLG